MSNQRDDRAHCGDENYRKPSKHKQWNEHSGTPVFAKPMTKAKILVMLRNFAMSYKVPETDITYTLTKVNDEYDDDANDCLQLTYIVTYRDDVDVRTRTIFSAKITIPDDLKKMAEEAQHNKAKASRRVIHITDGCVGTAEEMPDDTPVPVAAARRVVIRPAKLATRPT